MSYKLLRLLICVVLAAALPAGPARSDEPAASEGRSRPRPGDVKGVEEISEELVIIGKIQKPEVFYVLGRNEFAYRGIKLKRSFVDEIRRSVRDNPF